MLINGKRLLILNQLVFVLFFLKSIFEISTRLNTIFSLKYFYLKHLIFVIVKALMKDIVAIRVQHGQYFMYLLLAILKWKNKKTKLVCLLIFCSSSQILFFHDYLVQNFNPVEVLSAIKPYMAHFFGCHNCGQNFQKETENMLKEVTKPYDEVKFLWKSIFKKNHQKLVLFQNLYPLPLITSS